MVYDPTTWIEGAAPGISAAELNRIEAGVKLAHDPAYERSYRGGSDPGNEQDATSGVETRVHYPNIDDGAAPQGHFDNNAQTVTIAIAGVYRIEAGVAWGSQDADGKHAIFIRINGVTVAANIATVYFGAVPVPIISVATTIHLAVDDQIEIWVYQNSGASQDMIRVGQATFRTITFVRP